MPENGRSWTLFAIMIAMIFWRSGVRAPSAGAQDATDLYQSTAIVTGTDMRSRPAGFARCLRDVLVKVSGEPRLIQDARVAELGRRADAFVVSFSYVDVMAGIPIHDDQGTYDRPRSLPCISSRRRSTRRLRIWANTRGAGSGRWWCRCFPCGASARLIF